MSKNPRRKLPDDPDRPRSSGDNGDKQKNPSHRPGRTVIKKGPLIASSELDLRTLVLLSMGDWSELADLEWPPEDYRRWLEQADLRQVRGMLLTTLHRWHELRRGDT